MKSSISISNNVNLILNAYKCLFLFKLLLKSLMVFDSFDHATRVSKSDSVEMERFWYLQRSRYVNHNGTKTIDV